MLPFAGIAFLWFIGVVMISTCTLSLRTGILPRWIAYLDLGLFLLLGIGFFYWAPLVFTSWVFVISVHILMANMKRQSSEPITAVPR